MSNFVVLQFDAMIFDAFCMRWLVFRCSADLNQNVSYLIWVGFVVEVWVTGYTYDWLSIVAVQFDAMILARKLLN